MQNTLAYNVKQVLQGIKKNYKCIKLVGNIQIILDIANFFVMIKKNIHAFWRRK